MSKRITVENVRYAFMHVFQPRAFEDGPAKYSVTLMIPKKDKATINKINAAVKAAIEDGIEERFRGKKPASLRLPLRDGDEERAEDYPEFAGMYFMTANANSKPILLDRAKEEILDSTELYSGCWGDASITFFAYDSHGNKGIGVGLNALRKRRDDESFSGTMTAESARNEFDDLDDDDDDLLGDF